MVRAAGDDRRRFRESEVTGGFGRQTADPLRRLVYGSEPIRRDRAECEKRRIPRAIFGKKAALESPVAFAGKRARHPIDDVVIRTQHVLGSIHDLRFVLPEPQEFGTDGLLGNGASGCFEDVVGVRLLTEMLDLLDGPCVVLLYRRTKDIAVLIEKDQVGTIPLTPMPATDSLLAPASARQRRVVVPTFSHHSAG